VRALTSDALTVEEPAERLVGVGTQVTLRVSLEQMQPGSFRAIVYARSARADRSRQGGIRLVILRRRPMRKDAQSAPTRLPLEWTRNSVGVSGGPLQAPGNVSVTAFDGLEPPELAAVTVKVYEPGGTDNVAAPERRQAARPRGLTRATRVSMRPAA
jgi:hypothetical protein